MEALSQALDALEGSGTGRVTPMVLVDAVFGPRSYLREEPAHIARYDNGVITWNTLVSPARNLSAGKYGA
jgi:hypothetical protein